jgi:DHA1 family tetracycline resistance protein-like MFS transporter
MMTRRVSEREQGELQGAIGSLRSITFLIGPGLFSWTYGWFIDPRRPFHLPGAPYFLAAAMLFTAMLMSTRIAKTHGPAAMPAPPQTDVVPPEGVGSAMPPDA